MTMPLDTSTQADMAAGTQTGTAARSSGGHADSRSWQREMERAQAQDWFQGAVEYREHLKATQATAERTTHNISGAVVPGGTSATRNMSATVQYVATQAIRLGLGPLEWPTALAEARNTPGEVGRGGLIARNPGEPPVKDATVPARVASPWPAGVQPEPGWNALPMRVHVEIDETGARLWIGMTAPTDEQVDQAVSEIRRRLAERGIALAGVICNGKSWQHNLSAGADTAQPAQYPKEGVIHGIDR